MNFYQIILQAISPTGSISADWVLVGITMVAFFLFWRMLNKIENGLETVIKSVNAHNTKIELHDQAIEALEDDVKEIQKKL